MRRRSRAGGEPAKTRRHKAVTLKRRNAPKALRYSGSSAAGRDVEVARLTQERDEALQQQTATSEVLQVISSSPGDLETVFATMLKIAVRICEAKFGNIYRWDGETGHVVAMHNVPSQACTSLAYRSEHSSRSHAYDQIGGPRRQSCDRRYVYRTT